jgi:hypothetical protein
MFDIESWDNDTNQALLEVAETDGFSHYDVGELIYMSWQIDGNIGKFYFAMGDYPEPSEVELGWTRDMVLMAWGQPHDMQKLLGRDARRSERLVYCFEMHEGGVVYVWRPEAKTDYKAMRLFRKDIILDDDIVKEINKHDRW